MGLSKVIGVFESPFLVMEILSVPSIYIYRGPWANLVIIIYLNKKICFQFFYREPLSLAKMGQRLTAKSVFDMTTEPVAPSNGQIDMTPPTIRRLSGIPTRRGSISVT